VVVISPGEIGARSDDFSDAELNRAADEAIGDDDRSYEADFRVFAESLVAVPAGATGTTTALTTTTISSSPGGAPATAAVAAVSSSSSPSSSV